MTHRLEGGNVGIGRTAIEERVHIQDGNNEIRFKASNASGGYATFGLDSAATSDGRITWTNALIFGDSGSESMRISGGNLLVGKSSTGFSTAGIEARSGGTLWATASGTNAASFNRLSTNGAIAYFSKDGATAGSIGTDASGNLQTLSSSGNYRFGDSDTSRWSVDATRMYPLVDATYDIGLSSVRVRDLYLSGGVVFGDAGGSGTSSSNTLDSYEEGTWTPVLTKSTTAPSVTYNHQVGTYTKVGRMTYVSGLLSWTAISGGAGDFRIAGLPFTILSSIGAYPQMVSTDYSGVTFGANDATFGGYGATNGTHILLLAAKNNGTTSLAISGLATSGFIYFNLTYQAA